MKDKRPRHPPPLTGTLLENMRRCGPDDCWAYGYVRIAGKSYRIKAYEGGHARDNPAQKRWTLSFALAEVIEDG